jgi:hypothetical protein
MLCAAVICAASTHASATTTFFTDRTAFDAVVSNQSDPTGMSGVTSQAEANAATTDGKAFESSGTSAPAPDIDFTDMRISNDTVLPGGAVSHGFNAINDWAPGIAGAFYFIGNPTGESHTYEFTTGVSAFGFDMFQPSLAASCGGVTCTSAQFSIEAFDLGSNSLGTTTLSAGLGDQVFFGVTSDIMIGSIAVSETGTPRSSDHELFGNYVTGSVAPVPLPAGLPLMLITVGSLALLRRKR